MIEVEKVTLSLKSEFVECAQKVEGEHGMRTCSCCREPLLSKELSSFVNGEVTFDTVAIVDVDRMST